MKRKNGWSRRNIAEFAVYLLLFTAIVLALLVLVFRAIEIESEWRAERMCRHGYYCEEGKNYE